MRAGILITVSKIPALPLKAFILLTFSLAYLYHARHGRW